ncbi:MAG: sensor histidine kinase, partial [Acidimicrobiales bacterium]
MPSPRARACSPAPPGGAREHVWVTLMPWWHAAFAVTVAGTAAWTASQLANPGRLAGALALFAGLALLYWLTPGKFAGRSHQDVVYLAGAFCLFTGTDFIFPGAGFLLFILVPHCFMLMRARLALVATIGLVVVDGAAELASSGVSAATVASTAGLGALSVVLALALGQYISRIIDQSRQRAELIEELERTRSQLAEVSRQSGAMAEHERLAREIHDALAQGFTSVIMLLQGAQAALDRGDLEAAARQLALAEPAAREGLAEARSLIGALSPSPLQDATLVAAMERVCHELGARFGFAARLDVSGEAEQLSHNEEIVLLRAAQVALVNVGRHSGAASASVRLVFAAGTATLTVVDDGVGFDPSRVGFGLSQLRARAGELGGAVEVGSAPGEGTVVRVAVPLSPWKDLPVPGPSAPAGERRSVAPAVP